MGCSAAPTITVALAVTLLASCRAAPGPEALAGAPICRELEGSAAASRVPVVVILNDTMRRDRMGAYGGSASTPSFDAFARQNLLFRQVYSSAPWTRPAVASLFTGLLPSQHGVGFESERDPERARALPDELTTFAEVLRDAGYRTAAFVSNPWMDEKFGFRQGFDVYDDSFARWGYPGTALSDAALRWLEGVPPGEPYFLYVHYLDSHRPYPPLDVASLAARADRIEAGPRPKLSPRARAELRALVRVEGATARVEPTITHVAMAYEKGIERFDRALGRFLEGFAKRPDAAVAAIVVTSDHGEALYDRGYGNHGQGLYDDELAIPLAVRLPGITGPRNGVDCLAGIVDVMPTLCEYLGVECPGQLFGRSLLGGAAAAGEPRYLVSEGVGGQPSHRAVRNERFKLLYEPGRPPGGPRPNPWLLYDVTRDPQERTNLLAGDSEAVRGIFERLQMVLRAPPPGGPAAGAPVPIDPAVGERLRELGYAE